MPTITRKHRAPWAAAAAGMALLSQSPLAHASSHMDAPLITLDDPANTTDVYAFVSQPGSTKFLTVALAVYPFEEPGIGPNNFAFDPNVNYQIHVALKDDLAKGRATVSYSFDFIDIIRNAKTVQRSFLSILETATDGKFVGSIEQAGDARQNLRQFYRVQKVDWRDVDRDNDGKPVITDLAGGIAMDQVRPFTPPNNQGRVTKYYNQGDNGDNPAKNGVSSVANLDRYTAKTSFDIASGYKVFAGQRDDGFYADINAFFDGLAFKTPNSTPPYTTGFDSQAGFNVHTIVLNIPVSELGGDQQVVGVYATTNRSPIRIIDITGKDRPDEVGDEWAQVGRQGNPLFCEGLVAVEDKDRYNRTSPEVDSELFRKYAEQPELARLINKAGLQPSSDKAIESGRTDLSFIFIPDLIKTDLSTPKARLAGGGTNNPDDTGFSRQSVFGNDLLPSKVQKLAKPLGGSVSNIPGGWPNGRRFGDDVLDIAVSAVISDLRPLFFANATTTLEVDTDAVAGNGIDNVTKNDIGYNKVFPYAATPHNGRNHKHP